MTINSIILMLVICFIFIQYNIYLYHKNNLPRTNLYYQKKVKFADPLIKSIHRY